MRASQLRASAVTPYYGRVLRLASAGEMSDDLPIMSRHLIAQRCVSKIAPAHVVRCRYSDATLNEGQDINSSMMFASHAKSNH